MDIKDLLLTNEDRRKIFESYPCLDPSFEDDYKQEVAILLEAQLRKVQEAGWIDPKNVIARVTTQELEVLIDKKSLHEWARANGYVKLADDQSMPEKANWRRVIEELAEALGDLEEAQ